MHMHEYSYENMTNEFFFDVRMQVALAVHHGQVIFVREVVSCTHSVLQCVAVCLQCVCSVFAVCLQCVAV